MAEAMAMMIYAGGAAGAWQLKWGFWRSVTWPLELGAALSIWAGKQGKDAAEPTPSSCGPIGETE